MKPRFGKVLAIATMALLVLSLSGCSAILGVLSAALVAPDAVIADLSGNRIADAVATLTVGGATYTKTSDSSGYVYFTGATQGAYTLTAAKTGYYFNTVSGTFSTDGQNLGTVIGSQGLGGVLINARVKDEKIGGATVTLYSGTTAVATATSADSTGVFTFATVVSSGTYTVKATKATSGTTGYAFIDKTVDVSATTTDLGNVIGFSYGTTLDASTISIVAMWTKTMDVDSHITFPNAFRYCQESITDPYATTNPATGFNVDGDSTYRGHVQSSLLGSAYTTATVASVGGTSTDTRACIQLDVDNLTGAVPETVSIREIPFDWYSHTPAYGITGDSTNKLPTTTGTTFTWLGVAEYYVNGYSVNLSNESGSDGANLIIYIVQGSSVKGKFILPDYMAVKTASVIRINLFAMKDASNTEYSFYQFVPDIRLVKDNTYKSLSIGEVPTNEVIGVEGPAR